MSRKAGGASSPFRRVPTGAKLTDDDWQAISGRKEQLIERIQKRYGIAREEAERQVDNWSDALQEIVTHIAGQSLWFSMPRIGGLSVTSGIYLALRVPDLLHVQDLTLFTWRGNAVRITTMISRCESPIEVILLRCSQLFVASVSMFGLVLTLVAVLAAVLGAWRLGADPGWTSEFLIADGLPSRYQFWFAVAIAARTLGIISKRWAAKNMDVQGVAR